MSSHHSFTREEILQQPHLWDEVLASHAAKKHTLKSHLPNFESLRIIFTGAGSSDYAGKAAAYHLATTTNLCIESVATTDILAHPSDFFRREQPTLLVSFARSGNSPESLAVVKLANQFVDTVYHLFMTCNVEGALYKQHSLQPRTWAWLMPEGSNDRGFAMTSSLTTMYLSAIALFSPDFVPAPYWAAARRCRQLMDAPDFMSALESFATLPFKRCVYLGSGLLKAFAQEAALKMLELTNGAVVAMHESPLGFRHGPKTFVDRETFVVMALSGDSYSNKYDLDLIKEFVQDNRLAQLLVLSNGLAKPSKLPESVHWLCLTDSNVPDAAFYLHALAVAQLLSFHKSRALGIDPDNPCPSGEVNRVVQGVIIHPYEEVLL